MATLDPRREGGAAPVEPKFTQDFESIPDALIDVCLADDVQLLETFLREGGLAHINDVGKHDRTPLMLSAAWNASQSVALLLRYIHGAAPMSSSKTPTAIRYVARCSMDTASAKVSILMIDILIQALHLAAENNAKKSVEALVHGGALLDDVNDWGYTALHVAAAEGCLACAKELLIAGAGMDMTTCEDNATPLDLALKEGHQQMVLLLRGWDPTWSKRRWANGQQRMHPAMQTWSEAQVADFLRRIAMSQYVPVFLDRGIDGLALSEMTDARLEDELKMDRAVHRVRLLEAILFTQLNDGHVQPRGVDDDDNVHATGTAPPLAPVSPPPRRAAPPVHGPSPYLATFSIE
ncbi:Aste57867_247 [Aphanomyces stellatus]|uniref:Aste57867_247 protein n=1 Tax=Aphanomyces stellatus TaxID=120398 RepID=A0A485K566_9STRA|nr:hypothetical protein As57867_000247 [Aphanomyces stellatus]VFT77473.1 Aste57867_247 [Aphanomyces stellatus]